MMYYEISSRNGLFIVWKWTNNGTQCERVKSFKTHKAAESWANKQLVKVIWR